MQRWTEGWHTSLAYLGRLRVATTLIVLLPEVWHYPRGADFIGRVYTTYILIPSRASGCPCRPRTCQGGIHCMEVP